jgi:hypothetical protein
MALKANMLAGPPSFHSEEGLTLLSSPLPSPEKTQSVDDRAFSNPLGAAKDRDIRKIRDTLRTRAAYVKNATDTR